MDRRASHEPFGTSPAVHVGVLDAPGSAACFMYVCWVPESGVAQETQAAFGNALRGVFLTPLKTTAFRALFTCAAHFAWLRKEAVTLLHAPALIRHKNACRPTLSFAERSCFWKQFANGCRAHIVRRVCRAPIFCLSSSGDG